VKYRYRGIAVLLSSGIFQYIASLLPEHRGGRSREVKRNLCELRQQFNDDDDDDDVNALITRTPPVARRMVLFQNIGTALRYRMLHLIATPVMTQYDRSVRAHHTASAPHTTRTCTTLW